MTQPPELLLITWNRSAYLRKTLESLFRDPAEFDIYWWDNASEDQVTRDLFDNFDDDRIKVRHRSQRNVGQREPCLWFLENSKSDVIGKIDDDILLPSGWTERIAPMIRAHENLGMIGCWIFSESDWDEASASHSIIRLGKQRVFRTMGRAGQSFLARRELISRYVTPPQATYGLPVNQVKMSLDGFVNGFALPIEFAHNMDDPRSPHFVCGPDDKLVGSSALTARKLGFKTRQEYARWIQNDARKKVETCFEEALRESKRKYRLRVAKRCTQKFTSLLLKPSRASLRRP